MRRIPLSALIGLILTGGFFFVAIFAQLIAPYQMATDPLPNPAPLPG